MHTRKFAVEGLDGTGKTTMALKICKDLEAKGFTTFYYKDPYTLDKWEIFNKVLEDRDYFGNLPAFLIYLANRAWSVQNQLNQKLGKVDFIVMDRTHLSTCVYQIDAYPDKNKRGLLEKVQDLCNMLMGAGKIDTLIYLKNENPTPEYQQVLLDRIRAKRPLDSFEDVSFEEFFQRHEAYETLIQEAFISPEPHKRFIETLEVIDPLMDGLLDIDLTDRLLNTIKEK